MSLTAICKSLEEHSHSKQSHDSILLQYIRSVQIDEDLLSDYSKDVNFCTFVEHIFQAITSETYPSPAQGPIPPLYIYCLQFITQLSLSSPDLLSIVASKAPLNDLPQIFFSRNIRNNSIDDPQSTHLLTPLRFLCAICLSHDILISSTAAMQTLFIVLFSLLNTQEFSALSAGILSGISRNSSNAASYLRGLPAFCNLKNELIVLLTSNDHSIVVASASALTGLFLIHDEAPALMKVALHALKNPPALINSTKFASWTVLDLLSIVTLTSENISSIFASAIYSTGTRSYQLLSLLLDLESHGVNLKQPISSFYSQFIKYLINSKEDYITVAGVHLLKTIIDDDEAVDFEDDISLLFEQTLGLVLNSDLNIGKLEALAVLLSIMMKSCNQDLQQILLNHSSEVFTGLQRRIGSSQPFISVTLFSIIINIHPLPKEWISQLNHIIAETQFPALLVHVLTKSTSRQAIEDAMRVMQSISCGFSSYKESPLIDPIVSGFCIVNKNAQDEYETQKRTLSVTKSRLDSERGQLIRERESGKKEVEDLRLNKLHHEKLAQTQEQTISLLQNQVDDLQSKSKKKGETINQLKQQLEELAHENFELKTQLQAKDAQLTSSSQKISMLQTRLKGIQTSEQDVAKERKKREESDQKINELIETINNMKSEIEELEGLVSRERASKRETEIKVTSLTCELNAVKLNLEDQEKIADENEKQCKRLELMMKKKTTRAAEFEECLSLARKQLDESQQQLIQLQKTVKKQSKTISSLEEQIGQHQSAAEKEIILRRYIHELTSKKLQSVSNDGDLEVNKL